MDKRIVFRDKKVKVVEFMETYGSAMWSHFCIYKKNWFIWEKIDYCPYGRYAKHQTRQPCLDEAIRDAKRLSIISCSKNRMELFDNVNNVGWINISK